jgi:N-acetylmuramoyl-L-alanine amidase
LAKRKRKRIFTFLVFGLIGTLLITVYLNFFVISNNKVQKAKETEIPEWVDKQIIHKHSTARTGILLDDIKNIVIHYVGNPNTSAKNNRDYFNKPSTGVSSHFIVGLSGEVIQCVPIYERSAASNDRNKDTLSIETCHPDESGKFNQATYNSLVKLTAYLCYQFDLKQNDVIRHYDVTGKNCPKYYVENEDEWENFKKDVGKAIDDYRKAEKNN